VQDTIDSLPPDSKTSLSQAAVNLGQPPPTLDSAAEKAAGALQAAPINADVSPESLVLLAKAKLVNGKWDEAVQAYKKAIDKNPDDIKTLIEYAYALLRTGHGPLEIQKQLDQAVDLVRSSTDKDLKRRAYESATYQALYLPAPDGFEKAIRLGEEYTQDSSNPASGPVWVNLTCGYGQKVRWLKANQPSQDTKPLRDLALAAATKAIGLGDQWKATLHALMQPSDSQAARGENDLDTFAADPDFVGLLN
jgi:tetratricopeptide (TPR) repeat protein